MGRNAKTEQYSAEERDFWRRFRELAGTMFTTLRGLDYTFEVRGNEIFFDRKEKSVTLATVIQAYRKALELQANGIEITGPKQLGVFGASYLYPVIMRLLAAHGEAPPKAVED